MLNRNQRVSHPGAHHQRLVWTYANPVFPDLHVDRAPQDDVHLIARLVKMRPRIAELVVDPPMQNLYTRRTEAIRCRWIRAGHNSQRVSETDLADTMHHSSLPPI